MSFDFDTVSFDKTDSVDFFDVTEQQVLWNYHEIKELDKKSHPAILHALSAKHETRSTLLYRKETIKPMMSGGGKVSGGVSYSEKEGFKGEIKVEIDLGPKDDKDSSSDTSGGTGSSDVDSGDRDFDKDKN